MKNKSLLIATVFAASTTFAQDLTSKKGEPMLPEAGDWAISFDAMPFLNYFGNMFNGNTSNGAPTAAYTNGYPWAIKGKMFKDEKTAYRAGIRLGFGSKSWTKEIAVPQSSTATAVDYPNEPNMAEDGLKSGYNGIVLTGGLEMRRGKTRLQGYYGGELIFGMSGTKDAYTYGNALSAGSPDPTITASGNSSDWSGTTGYANLVTDPAGGDGRITEKKSSMMTFGLRGFIGAEYFVAAKISIGAEYGWGLGFNSTKTSTSTEGSDVPASSTTGDLVTGSFTKETKVSGFSIDSDIQNSATGLFGPAGSLNITFHF